MTAAAESAGGERQLRACVRDLVALSAMQELWIGRPARAVADSLRDLLVSMLRADAAYVQLSVPDGDQRLVAVVGARECEFESALGRSSQQQGAAPPSLGDADPPVRLASVRVGLEGEMGRLAVGSRRSGFPSEPEALLMQMAATQVAVALQQAALLLRRERAEEQQAAVLRLGLRALSGIPLDELLAETVAVVRDTLRVDCCEILELAPDGRSLLLTAGVGWRPELAGRARVGAGADSQAGYTLGVQQAVVVEDVRRERRFAQSGLLREQGVVSGITVIVHDRERPFGVLGAHAREARAYTRENVDFLQVTANLLATALQRHRAEVGREESLARTSAAQAEAEKASRSKSAFLGMMSHELRTPLGAITGYVELMELGIHGPLTAEQHHDLGRIRHGAKYLLGLINNVLDYLRLGSGQVRYEITSVSVADTIAAVEDLIRPQMEAKRLQYERSCAGDGLRVRADRDKLQQIVLNLLSNATKFTGAGGRVRIECGTGASTVSIRVADTGCGIPEDKLESVFEPFVQAEGGHASQGTGLGLAISRDFAAAMGGTLLVESQAGKGSAFTVVLPRHA